MDREYNEAMDDLRFSPAAKERMAARLAAAQEQARAARPQPDVYAARGGKRRWRFAAAAAATLVLAVGLAGGAYASGALMGVGNVMDDLFGGPPAQTEVVGKIGRPLGASATSNGVTVTAEAIIGDRANYTIVFSVAKDDGTPFEGVEALDNGTLPLGFGEGAGVHVDGVTTGGGSSHFYGMPTLPTTSSSTWSRCPSPRPAAASSGILRARASRTCTGTATAGARPSSKAPGT